jgi:hypothetical protein
MTLNRRFVVALFAALFVLAQQEAAVHAIGHLPELLAGAEHSHDDEDAAPHKCPDCARFASISVGAAAPDTPALEPTHAQAATVRPVLVAIASSPLERPRNRSPPQA